MNGARLMPSFALSQGINYYVLSPPGGPLYSTLYGPLVALVYWPATLFHDPNTAVLAGSAITTLFCFLAIACLQFAPWGVHRGMPDVLGFLAAGFLAGYLEPLKYSCFNIHADGPGLMLAAFASAALYPGVRQKRAAVPCAGICAALAIFCKQMFVPVPAALWIYLLLARERRAALKFLCWSAAAGVVALAASLLAYGAQPLYHCLVWLPGHHPWNLTSHFASFVQSGRHFLRVAMPVPVVLLACVIYFFWEARETPAGVHKWTAYRAAPLLLVGLSLLPLSIAGRAKVGGDINSLSFALFFFTCGLTVLLADMARAETASTRHLATAVLWAVLAPLAISEAALALDIPAKIRQLPQSGQEVAFHYLQHHPGTAYFPWFPQSHYLAEHQFRHYSFGLGDRLMAGEPVGMSEFDEYIPPHPRLIAFAPDGTTDIFGFDIMRYFPGYSRQTKDPQLPGWTLYTDSSE